MAKKNSVGRQLTMGLLPLFIITVCLVFSFMFTVIMTPLASLADDIKMIFVMMLVLSTTVASAVSIIFYVFFFKK